MTKKWTTRDGTKVRICDMTDTHLSNAIKYLERLHQQTIADGYGVLSMMQGEMAITSIEAEIESLEEEGPATVCALYEDLLNERERRMP